MEDRIFTYLLKAIMNNDAMWIPIYLVFAVSFSFTVVCAVDAACAMVNKHLKPYHRHLSELGEAAVSGMVWVSACAMMITMFVVVEGVITHG
jgi:hypothetical protein|nr:MAG TPA: hypothetical protein [Caudoviricetes sp.]